MTVWSAHGSIAINASSAEVWKSIIDIEACPKIITEVVKVELVSGDTKMEEGTQWRETRTYADYGTVTMLKTITKIVENDPYFEIQISVAFPEDPQYTNTSTLSLQPATGLVVEMQPDGESKSFMKEEEDKCVLLGTFAFFTHGCLWGLRSLLCGLCATRYAAKSFQKELECYKTAVEYSQFETKQKKEEPPEQARIK